MKFITKTSFTADYDKMRQDLIDYLNSVGGWNENQTIDGKYYSGNQLGIKHRVGAKYPILDSTGSLYDKTNQVFTGKESEFTEYVDVVPEYTKQIITQLETHEDLKFGRIRYMRLKSKTGLSVHHDMEYRYHFVFDTNPYAFFGEATEGEVTAKCYHIPNDSTFYKVDVTRPHFVYNGGWEDRIHLVLNVASW